MTALDSPVTHRRRLPRLLSAAGAVLALPPLLLCSLSGTTGAEAVASVEDRIVSLEVGGFLAAIASALLLMAAARLGNAIPGLAGRVAGAAGAVVAAAFAAYYGAFAAGAATVRLSEDPSPALGESIHLLINVIDYARYAPGLALVLAAYAVRKVLPRTVWISALVLAVLTLVPLTSWAAAIMIPIWLGVSAAVVDD